MKIIAINRWIALFGIISVLLSSLVTPAEAADARSIEAQLRMSNPDIQVEYHNQTGLASFVYVPNGISVSNARSSSTPQRTALLFMQEFGAIFGITTPNEELKLIKEFKSIDGDNMVRFQQMHQNIPVVGAQINLSVTSARTVKSINGELSPRITIKTTPTITGARALQIGIKSVQNKFKIDEAKISQKSVSLAIFDQRVMGGFAPPIPILTWQVRLTNRTHVIPFDAYIFVNAQTGQIIAQFNQIAHALSQRICDNNNALDLDDNPRSNCDNDSKAVRLDSETASGIPDVDTAWEYTKATYDYFYDRFGRDGIDGAGKKMISIVRYCYNSEGSSNCPYANAFWDGEVMTYGEGFSSADDVIAHEITHGITERTANLYYYFQSGAINEAISDIFGEFVDQAHIGSSTDGNTYKWQLGEDLPASIGVIRNMRNPLLFNHPDRMTSRYYESGFYPGYEWPLDEGGVHSNSGVANKAAVLMVTGGTFNRQTIIGLGQSKTEQVFYRVLTNLLLSASDYSDLANALMITCNDMVNRAIAGMTAGNCINLNRVILATEMRKSPTNAPAVDAPFCPAGKTVRNLFYDNMENYTIKWLPTGGGWYYSRYATSLEFSAKAYADSTRLRDLRLTQRENIRIPANAYLHFNHAYEYASLNLSSTAPDQFFHGSVVEYSTNNGRTWQNLGSLFINQGYNGTLKTPSKNPLKGQRAFVGVSNGYISSRANLATLSGTNIKLRFRYVTDGTNYTWYGWWIDNIRIYTCR